MIAATGKLGTANRPRYLFSGLTKCGVCGAGFIIGSANRLMCFGARDQGTCSNRLTIRRDEVEQRVLHALQEKLLRQDLFDEFCEEFTREMNRLRGEHRANLVAGERELAPSFESSFGGGVGGFAIGFGVETVSGREPVVVFDTPSGRQPIKITVTDANVTGVKVLATR